VSAATPQEQARDILADPRYREGTLPRPLHGVFEALGRRLRPVGDAIDDVIRAIDGVLPGGRSLVWLLLSVLVVVTAAIVASRLLRRRLTVLDRAQAAVLAGAGGRTPEQLERDADGAEASGHLDAALRLRFAAGLLRLAGRGVVEVRPSTSNAELSLRLRRAEFDRLAWRFDQTAYGGRPVEAADLDEARADWASLLSGAPA